MRDALIAALGVVREVPKIAPPGYPIGGATIDSIIFEIERAIRLAGERGRDR
jgi:hypothetical protein